MVFVGDISIVNRIITHLKLGTPPCASRGSKNVVFHPKNLGVKPNI